MKNVCATTDQLCATVRKCVSTCACVCTFTRSIFIFAQALVPCTWTLLYVCAYVHVCDSSLGVTQRQGVSQLSHQGKNGVKLAFQLALIFQSFLKTRLSLHNATLLSNALHIVHFNIWWTHVCWQTACVLHSRFSFPCCASDCVICVTASTRLLSSRSATECGLFALGVGEGL